MHDDKDYETKDKLLADLIERMEDVLAGGMKPEAKEEPKKGLAVQVAAPDKEHLEEGLEKAQDLVSAAPSPKEEEPSEESDEDRLLSLLGDEEDDDEDKK